MQHLTLNENELKVVKVALILCKSIIQAAVPIEYIKGELQSEFENEMDTITFLIRKIDKAFENEEHS